MTISKRKQNKIQKLDEKIKQMEAEKERILQETQKKIGIAVINEWASYDTAAILKAIKELKSQAIKIIESSEEENSEEDAAITNDVSPGNETTNETQE